MRADRQTVERLLKTARGQIDGILKMVEDDRYCVDISTQISAARSVLAKADREVLHAHMLGCVREAFASGDSETEKQKIAEILALIDRMGKSE